VHYIVNVYITYMTIPYLHSYITAHMIVTRGAYIYIFFHKL